MNFKELYERLISTASTNVNAKADNIIKAAANNVIGDEYLKQYLINAVRDDNNLADNPNTFKYYPYSGFMGKAKIFKVYIKILFEKSENDGLYIILLKYDLHSKKIIYSADIIGEITFEDDDMIFKNTKYCPHNLKYLKHVIEKENEWFPVRLYNDDAHERFGLIADKNIEACNELLQAILYVLKQSYYLEQIDKDINERLIQNAASGINKEANNISNKVFGASLGDMADEFRLILKDTLKLDDKNEEYWDNFPVKAGGVRSYNTHRWTSRFRWDFIQDNPYLLSFFAWHLSTASKSKLYDYMIGQDALTKYGLNGNICTYIYYQPGHSDYLWHVSSYFIPHDEELIKEHVTKVKFVDFTIDKNDPTIKHLREYDDQRYEKMDDTWDPSYKKMIEKRDYAFVSKLGQIIKSSIPNIPEYIEKAKSYIATNYKDRYKKSSYIFDPKTPEGIIEKTIYTKIPKEIASNDNISMFDAMSKLYNRSIYVDDNGNNYMFDYGMSEHEECAANTPIISATFKIPQIAKYNGQTYMTYKMDKKTAIIDIDSSKMNNNFLYINGIMTPYGKAFIQELVNTLFQLKDENDDLYDKRLSFAESNKDNEDVNEKIEDM